jgi:ubiquinone/menaquinone biosynthesis C-methylase UbiE
MMTDEAWERRQAESVARYSDEHYNEDPRPARMFGNFIATTLTDRSSVVLDIGCGISPEMPRYVDELGLTNYTGLDPLDGPECRAYPWLRAMAENIPVSDSSVDVVLFATSFDHIAGARQAIEEVHRVLKPGGRMYMWQGISDPDVFADTTFMWRLRRGLIGVPQTWAQAAKAYARMAKRRRDLAVGARLDAVHERWFTRTTLIEAVSGWGFTPVRAMQPFGLSSMFIDAKSGSRPNP